MHGRGGCGELKFNGKRLMNDGHEKMSNLISNQKGLCEFPVLEGGRAAFDATCCPIEKGDCMSWGPCMVNLGFFGCASARRSENQ